jgi:hypothetical protein
MLILSYEFMKPPNPNIHSALVEWVKSGGVLLYIGDGSDPYHRIREWWNTNGNSHSTPAEHLWELLGLPKHFAEGTTKCGKGYVVAVNTDPSRFAEAGADAELRSIASKAYKLLPRGASAWRQQNYILLRRGPYVIAAVLDESISDDPLHLQGTFINLFDPQLPLVKDFTIRPGERALLLDLDRTPQSKPAVLASASRVYNAHSSKGIFRFQSVGPKGVRCVTAVRMPNKPAYVKATPENGAQSTAFEQQWDPENRVLWLKYDNSPEGVSFTISM